MRFFSGLLKIFSDNFMETMIIILAFTLTAFLISLPHVVILKESIWECTRAGTQGLDTQCLEYRHKL
jgi:hypothetical protein